MQTAQASHSPSSSACIHDTGCDAYIYSHRLRQNSVVSAHSIASNCTVSSERDVKSRAPVSHPRLTSQRAPILVCTMANPMTNICANFDQVGQVRSRVARRPCPTRAPAKGHTRSGLIARETMRAMTPFRTLILTFLASFRTHRRLRNTTTTPSTPIARNSVRYITTRTPC